MTNYKITDDGGATIAIFTGTVGDTIGVFAYGPGHTSGLLLTSYVAKAPSASPLTPGTYGDAATVPQITINSQGIITAIAGVPISLSTKKLITTET